MRIERPGVRTGYDLWAETYDITPNPVVAIDARVTAAAVAAQAGERVLDAGCGTGRNLPGLLASGAAVVGMDFSSGMLAVARRNHPDVPLVLADMQVGWPFRDGTFDVVLCALVGEHLDRLAAVTREMRRVLAPAGRAVFSVYHPAMAEAGKEANFQHAGTEYRLGAVRHSLADYITAFEQAGFTTIRVDEYSGDDDLARVEPVAAAFIGFPLLVVITGKA
ncbi:MAG TPA: class I SAM-dependent methyltransferase [Thermomicrobiales bacterium]|nr:class I SAM-dependent methyltransferase [Thermomicrobiales bacterium]